MKRFGEDAATEFFEREYVSLSGGESDGPPVLESWAVLETGIKHLYVLQIVWRYSSVGRYGTTDRDQICRINYGGQLRRLGAERERATRNPRDVEQVIEQ